MTGSSGALSLDFKPKKRRLAVVFIDDLDRCSPKWVSRLLDCVRRYVTCQGVVFVIAADRQVISAAFEEVVHAFDLIEVPPGLEKARPLGASEAALLKQLVDHPREGWPPEINATANAMQERLDGAEAASKWEWRAPAKIAAQT